MYIMEHLISFPVDKFTPQIAKVCLHVLSPCLSPSKFEHDVNGNGQNGYRTQLCLSNGMFYWSLCRFDGDEHGGGHGLGTCEQTLTLYCIKDLFYDTVDNILCGTDFTSEVVRFDAKSVLQNEISMQNC